MKVYKGQTLHNCRVSYKIDGVQAILKDGKWLSRAGKPLYNLPLHTYSKELYSPDPIYIPEGRYEVFLGDWSKSVSAVRTVKPHKIAGQHDDGSTIWIAPDKIPFKALYRLDEVDGRLFANNGYDGRFRYTKIDCPIWVETMMKRALRFGYEGLVLTADEGEFKVKPIVTYDVPVIDMIEGKGRNKGRLGALVTDMGNVGTGLTDLDRKIMWEVSLIGFTIEVECMELTPNGKFRHPRFVRIREDK